MTTDSISDFIISIKNANRVNKETMTTPYSKLRAAIADALVKEGFIKSASKKGKKVQKHLEVELAYGEDGKSRIEDVERISKVSKRMYFGVSDIRSVRQGFGKMFISTSKGIMTGGEARKQKLGGEPLFRIW